MSQTVPEGEYPGTVQDNRTFSPDELVLNGSDIEKLSLRIGYKVIVERAKLVSHFDVASRGRFAQFTLTTATGNTVHWQVVMRT